MLTAQPAAARRATTAEFPQPLHVPCSCKRPRRRLPQTTRGGLRARALAPGFFSGLLRQATIFVKRSELLLKQLLAVSARLCKPTGSRRIDQQQHKERLQFRRQREQGQARGSEVRPRDAA